MVEPRPAPPLALVAELSHRCPLSCPYCANPLELAGASRELPGAVWHRVFSEAAELGVLQLHLSGGEPLARRDLDGLVAHASGLGLYTNLITSGIGLDAARAQALAAAGLDHVQLSFQDAEAEAADAMAGLAGAHARKLAAASAIAAAGLAMTANFVIHRGNTARVGAMIALGTALGARRIEIAHTQYHGWALANRALLMPDAQGLAQATEAVQAARAELHGRVVIDYVLPDYHASMPKACMGGWGQRMLVITPAGRALPCHAAMSIPGLPLPDVQAMALADIWNDSEAFARFRGTAWMQEPCRSCAKREEDWGGCRCQALALLGDASATDPVCALSPQHGLVQALREDQAAAGTALRFRRITAAQPG